MRRCGILILVVAALGSCGRKEKDAGESGEQQAAPLDEKAYRIADLKKKREKYINLVVKAYPENYSQQYGNAAQFLPYARDLGDRESITFFEGEIARIEKEYRAKALQIRDRADGAARLKSPKIMAPDEVWYDRCEIWEQCVNELERWQLKFRERGETIDDLVQEARDKRDVALLLQKAYMRFKGSAAAAKTALEFQNDAEIAVAHLAIFRAWMRSNDLMPEEPDDAVVAETPPSGKQAEKESSGRDLLSQLDTLTAEYVQKLPEPDTAEGVSDEGEGGTGSDIAKIPWEDVSVDEFMIYFNWTSEEGTCDAEDEAVVADGSGTGGLIEAADTSWNEFMLEFEIQLISGKRFWLGARPSVSGETQVPQYKRKMRVALRKKQWHRLRVQVQSDKLSVFDVTSSDQPVSLEEPVDLLPVTGSGVRAGFMIGLEAQTKIELRKLRYKVISGTPEETGEEEEAGEEEAEEEEGGEEEPAEEGEESTEDGNEEEGDNENELFRSRNAG